MPRVSPSVQIPATPRFMPYDLLEAAGRLEQRVREGRIAALQPIPTFFLELDRALGGGFRGEDLVLIGAKQNIGKTTLALQMARNQAKHLDDLLVLYVSYDHSVESTWLRLFCLESVADPVHRGEGRVDRAAVEAAFLEAMRAQESPRERAIDMQVVLRALPGAMDAWQRLSKYHRRLWLIQGDGLETHDGAIEEYVRMAELEGAGRIVLYVDYAQRVPLRPLLGMPHVTTEERIDLTIRGLKNIACDHGIPVVAVAAADAEALRGQRVHVENLWGPATVAYEPDICLILNPDTRDDPDGERWVRIAVEKNRSGPSELEWRHRRMGKYFCVCQSGKAVGAEESYQVDRLAFSRDRGADLPAEQGGSGDDRHNSQA